MAGVTLLRLKKEMEMIEKDPPPGCSAWAAGDSAHELEAVIQGADDTPYAKGCFRLRITVPQRYPFEPPKVHFVTPIYHPNIDSAGRICLDILNMPDGNGKGAWKPSLNLKTVLLSIRLLMSEPNPDDGLMVDITHEYIHNRALFERTSILAAKSLPLLAMPNALRHARVIPRLIHMREKLAPRRPSVD